MEREESSLTSPRKVNFFIDVFSVVHYKSHVISVESGLYKVKLRPSHTNKNSDYRNLNKCFKICLWLQHYFYRQVFTFFLCYLFLLSICIWHKVKRNKLGITCREILVKLIKEDEQLMCKFCQEEFKIRVVKLWLLFYAKNNVVTSVNKQQEN